MMNIPELKQKAAGRYIEIVGHFIPDLIEPMQTLTRGIKCPCHGNKDGFNFGNRFNETGRGFCQLTGSKDIFEILEMWLRWSFIESYIKLSKYLAGESPPASNAASYKIEPVNWIKKKNTLNRYHSQTIPDNGLIKKYLHSRGIDTPVPPTIRLHESLEYFEQNKSLGSFPAMVCKIILNLTMVGLHFTYLKKDGSGKADVPVQRKMHSCSPLFNQGYIPLYEFNNWAGSTLCVGEGIETCLAVHEMTDRSVWCAMSTTGLENIRIPDSIIRIEIITDNDFSQAGMRAALKLQERLEKEGRVAGIGMPEYHGDWNDYLFNQKEKRDE